MNYILLMCTFYSVYRLIRLLNSTYVDFENDFLFRNEKRLICGWCKSCYSPRLYAHTFCIIRMAYPCSFQLRQLSLPCWVSVVFAPCSFHCIGNELSFVFASAIYTVLAITIRQTNIILAVLNPALILLLRVVLCCYFHVVWFTS